MDSEGALKLPQRAAKRFLVHFRAENASGDNHCLGEFLGENPLIPYLTRGDIAVGGSGRNLVSVYYTVFQKKFTPSTFMITV